MKRILTLSAFLCLAVFAVPSFGQSAADLYKTKCAMCHGADGKGATPMGPKIGVRDFHSPAVAKETDAEMIALTTGGKNKMPAYKGKLTDDQIKDLVKYIRALK
jgi:mono/diheme cytochrome c family protein